MEMLAKIATNSLINTPKVLAKQVAQRLGTRAAAREMEISSVTIVAKTVICQEIALYQRCAVSAGANPIYHSIARKREKERMVNHGGGEQLRPWARPKQQ